jgi:hypothetical protein
MGMHSVGGYLTCVHLMDVLFTYHGAYLTGVYLMSIYLIGMHFTSVYIMGVHLKGVNLVSMYHYNFSYNDPRAPPLEALDH